MAIRLTRKFLDWDIILFECYSDGNIISKPDNVYIIVSFYGWYNI